MYTQCPGCDTAFRISAEVLKKAAGQVRCGGCNVAFNALDYLSEDVPNSAPPTQTNTPEPKLTPEKDGGGASSLPKKISARRTATLMKTLDELAGSDIQLEDTGIEWRVLDEETFNDEPDSQAEAAAESELNALTGSMNLVVGNDYDESDELLIEQSSTSNVMRFDDDTPLPDDFDADGSTPVATDESISAAEEPAEARDFDDPAVDLALGEPDEWEQLLGEVDVSIIENLDAMDDQADDNAPDKKPGSTDVESRNDAAVDIPPEMDTQFEIQAMEMGVDLSGMHKSVGEDDDTAVRDDGDRDNRDVHMERRVETAGTGIEEVLKRIADLDQKLDIQLDDQTDSHLDFRIDAGSDNEIEVVGAEDIFSEEEEIELALFEESEDADDEPETSIDDDLIAAAFESERRTQGMSAKNDIPLLTEEEKTINMMIDEDFMRHTEEAGNLFSPIVIDERAEAETNPMFETIVMEGDSVRTAIENEAPAANAATGLQRSDDAAASSTYRADRDYDKTDDTEPVSRRIVAATVALVLLLVGQVLHQSRNALATNPLFSQTVGAVYRFAGSPLTPNWDITSWRFEVSKGSSDENDEMLTIYSRIGNTSESALPYPLVHVSLMDRFEEVVGSKVLEPREYLAGNPNLQQRVAPGNTFNAIISIESPPYDATGFKLNTCYRIAADQLRCAIEDFR